MQIKLSAKELSDGSFVYDVFLDQMGFETTSRLSARKFADRIYRAVKDFTNLDVDVVFSDNFHEETTVQLVAKAIE